MVNQQDLIKQVSILSFETILDALNKESDLHKSSKLFFATLANESAKNFTIRKHYAYIPKPVFDLLFEIISDLYQEYVKKDCSQKIKEKIDVIETILAGVDMDKFELDQPRLESVFELGRLLNDEENTEINVVCNESQAKNTPQLLINKYPHNKYEFEPMTTEQWIIKHLTS